MKKILFFLIASIFQNHTLYQSDVGSSNTSAMDSFPSSNLTELSTHETNTILKNQNQAQDRYGHNSSKGDSKKQDEKNSSKKGAIIVVISLIGAAVLISCFLKSRPSQEIII